MRNEMEKTRPGALTKNLLLSTLSLYEKWNRWFAFLGLRVFPFRAFLHMLKMGERFIRCHWFRKIFKSSVFQLVWFSLGGARLIITNWMKTIITTKTNMLLNFNIFPNFFPFSIRCFQNHRAILSFQCLKDNWNIETTVIQIRMENYFHPY